MERLSDDPLELRPIESPELLAFLGGAARSEVMGVEREDLLLADRFDAALLVACAMECGYLGTDGRVTALGRDFADAQLSPLLPLHFARPEDAP
jgi:hypothetical protein